MGKVLCVTLNVVAICGWGDKLQRIKTPRCIAIGPHCLLQEHSIIYSCLFKLVWFSYVGNKKRTSAECPSCSFYTLIVNGDCLKMIKCSLNVCLLYWYTNISCCFVCTSLQGLLSVTWESCLNRSWHLSYMMTGSKLQCKSVHAACLFLYGWC